ncbi:MAG: histidine kinase [Candidatus Limivicinus sp.]|jgi:two-component system sensor histidine kinase YesM
MRSWLRKSFRNQILAMVLFVTMVPLLLCGALMLQLQVARITGGQEESARTQLDSLEAAMDELGQQLEDVTKDLSESTIVRSALRSESSASRSLYQVLSRDTAALRELADFEICFADGNCGYTTDPLENMGRYDTDWGILARAGESDELIYRAGERGTGGMRAARAVFSRDGSALGYIVVNMSEEQLSRLFRKELALSSALMIADRFWNTIYVSQSSTGADILYRLRSQLMEGEALGDPGGECSYFVRRLSGSGFFLILQQPRAFTQQALRTFYQVSIAAGILSLVLSSIYALYWSKHLAEPIHRLDEAMGRVKSGDFSAHLDMEREDELGRLAESFNRMTREYRANLERSVDRQKKLNSAQVRLMQAQLNPHFLYNTLDSIKWLGVTNNVPQISSMATDLAGILRDSISGEEFVTLEHELEIIERYLEIQYIRFEDRFVCETDVEERFQHCIIPKLSLQPLVENAIIHGVADQEEGYIKITAEERDGDLLLCVADNGCGIPEDVLEALRDPAKKIPGRHLGLSNVDQIAKLHYGPGYGVYAHSAPGEGSRVFLKIPMIKREEQTIC